MDPEQKQVLTAKTVPGSSVLCLYILFLLQIAQSHQMKGGCVFSVLNIVILYEETSYPHTDLMNL